MENFRFYWDEYVANREKHEDYYNVMENYSNTPILNEILRYMNEKFPNWNSNSGIGFYAAEFVSDFIDEYESFVNHKEYYQNECNESETENGEEIEEVEFTKRELKFLHQNLAYNYSCTLKNFENRFDLYVIEQFDDYLEALIENEVDDAKIEELEDLSQQAYDKMFEEFKSKLKEKIIYDFKSELIFD